VKKVVSGGGGGIWHHHNGKARHHGGAEFDAKECRAPTHYQYKTTLNMYDNAKPIGRSRCTMSLMSNSPPKIAMIVASRCCVHDLHTCMNKIIYSNHLTHHFLAALHKNVTSLSIYRYSICMKNNKYEGVENILLLNEDELLYGLCVKKIHLSSTSQPIS
jgi:hypothetical protein